MTRKTTLRIPLVRRARLTRALNEINGLRHSLTEHANEAKRREQDARDKVSDQRTVLIASVVGDYYRALACVEDHPGRRGKDDPFIRAQFGIMQHAQTVLARLTGKDTIILSYALDAGLPVAGEPRVPGDAPERRETLMAPYRRANAGVYAHLAPEDRGPIDGPADAAFQRDVLGISL